MKIQKSARKSGLQKLVISASIVQNLSRLMKLRFQPEYIYIYTKIEIEDGCRLGWPLKNLYASRGELQKELEKKKKGSNNND